MAEQPGVVLDGHVAAHLEAVYGITHPDALAPLLPRIKATVRALHGLHQDHPQVDPIVRRQLRHTSMRDGHKLTSRGDIDWAATAS
ncbi:MAG: hypothetical protein WAS01_10955 [Nostocoides sp.]